MKFNLLIYQKGLLEVASKINVREMIVLTWIKDICAVENDKLVRKEVNNTYFTWINYDWLIKDLPCLKIKSKGTVTKLLQNLEKYKLIITDKQTKLTLGFKVFVALTDKAARAMDISRPISNSERVGDKPISHRKQTDFPQETNPTTIDHTTKKIKNKGAEAPGIEKSQINQIFNIFYNSINPGINYGNKTSRKAAEWLIKKIGINKAIATTEYAVSVQGKQYAPTITTPYQLKEKLGALMVYYKRQSQGGKIAVYQPKK